MFVTTVASHAYDPRKGFYDNLTTLIDRMPTLIGDSFPRVPNPVDPAEDFADLWSRDARYEASFWSWHEQLSADITALLEHLSDLAVLKALLARAFDARVTDELEAFLQRTATPKSGTRRIVHIESPPRPWSDLA